MEENDLRNKLIGVERVLTIFDSQSDDILQEIPITIPIDKLITVVIPKDGDHDLSLPYELDEAQIIKLSELLESDIQPALQIYYYVLEANGIYNW
jgi:hypothetical protein